MEDFNLVVRELINQNQDIKKISIPKELIPEFETTAENYLTKESFLEAIKVFAITKNKDKLNQIGKTCLEDKKPEMAFKAFYYSQNKEGLSKTGDEFLKQGEINNALESFQLAENKEMIEFLVQNF